MWPLWTRCCSLPKTSVRSVSVAGDGLLSRLVRRWVEFDYNTSQHMSAQSLVVRPVLSQQRKVTCFYRTSHTSTGNVSQPSLQPAIEQYRSILADKQAEAHERLEQVKAYVVAASRQLEHQRSQVCVRCTAVCMASVLADVEHRTACDGSLSAIGTAGCRMACSVCTWNVTLFPHLPAHLQLGVLLEWCRIRQLSLIGQMRSNYCCHSVLDQLADVAVRAAAALRWEPELRQMQGALHAVLRHAVLQCAGGCGTADTRFRPR